MTTAPPSGIRPAGDRRVAVALDRREAVTLLGTAAVGRLVFTFRALPEVFPVNFRLFEGSVVVRLADSSHALQGALDAVVAFQVDDIDVATRTGWSVTVVGHSSEILDPAERDRVLALPLVAWADGSRDRLVRIPLDRVTGRRLTAAGAAGHG